MVFKKPTIRGAIGEFENTSGKRCVIRIDPKLRGSELLDTMIHEITHAAFPDLSEDAVNRFATDAATILWNDGYRRCDNG
jgi:hypothetical protein